MKNIFLLFGGHNGDIVKKLDKLDTQKVYNKKDIVWNEIHVFEPQPYHKESLTELQQKDYRVIYHPVAVSIENTRMPFYIKGEIGYDSSTLDMHKFTGKLYDTVEVDVIDIIEWIKQNTSEDDFVVIDMDIECEEYRILPKLITDDISKRIAYISIEFHSNKSRHWSKDNLDAKIHEDARNYFGNKLLSHNKYFG